MPGDAGEGLPIPPDHLLTPTPIVRDPVSPQRRAALARQDWRPLFAGMQSQLTAMFGTPRLRPVDPLPPGAIAVRTRYELSGQDVEMRGGPGIYDTDGFFNRLDIEVGIGTPEILGGIGGDVTLRVPFVVYTGTLFIAADNRPPGNPTLIRDGEPNIGEPVLDLKLRLLPRFGVFRGLALVGTLKIPMGSPKSLAGTGVPSVFGQALAAFGDEKTWGITIGSGFGYNGISIDGSPNERFTRRDGLDLRNIYMFGAHGAVRVAAFGTDSGLFVHLQYQAYENWAAGEVSGVADRLHDIIAGLRLRTDRVEYGFGAGVNFGPADTASLFFCVTVQMMLPEVFG
jgi:hypothetical protein